MEIALTFSEDLTGSTVTAANIAVYGFAAPNTRSAALALDTAFDADGVSYETTTLDTSIVRVRLAAADAHAAYKVVISASVLDTAGNAYSPIADTDGDGIDEADIEVRKADTVAPFVRSGTQFSYTSATPPGYQVVLTFSEAGRHGARGHGGEV